MLHLKILILKVQIIQHYLYLKKNLKIINFLFILHFYYLHVESDCR